MRVQIIYGEHAKGDFDCGACGGAGSGPGGKCWTCLGAGNLVSDLRTYTYEAPEGTQLWQVLTAPTPEHGGKRGTVVRLSSDYAGPCREAYPLPVFPCKGNCGTALRPADPRYFCRVCWERVPQAMRAELDAAAGFRALSVVRAIVAYLTIVDPAPRSSSLEGAPE